MIEEKKTGKGLWKESLNLGWVSKYRTVAGYSKRLK